MTPKREREREAFVIAYKNQTGQAPVEWEGEFNSPSVQTAWALWQAASASSTADIEKLVDAAKAVVARWDSPSWKDLPHTANYIHVLRTALIPFNQPCNDGEK